MIHRAFILPVLLILGFLGVTPGTLQAATTPESLDRLDITTFPADKREDARRMLSRDVSERIREANRRESETWQKVRTRAEWEAYVTPRIERMRTALTVPVAGSQPPPKVAVVRTISGDGFVVDDIAFESRPGLFVTANLYRPAKPPASLPGIVISHSHHNPKTEGELRDMGIGWARAGCYVIVPDHLGHGERREHPFATAESFPKSFRAGRQDYYFRYNSSLQLYAAGESLMGWMAHDLSRCIDVLLSQPGIDAGRIALLGAVAGGGDPAAVTAALDPRIKAVAPFNFGGPQPETRYPLPEDAETWFNYAGGGSWESTRNLTRSAADGFLPWVIVGSVAPRTLVYGHEFTWDQPRDPVWKRFEAIWNWYDAKDKLGFAHGRGGLKGQPPEATHCNNIGPEHRKMLAAWLKRAANIPEPLGGAERPKTEDLLVKPADAGLKPLKMHEVAGRMMDQQLAAFREKLAALPAEQRIAELRKAWSKILGDTEPPRAGVQDEVTPGQVSGANAAPGLDVAPVLNVAQHLLHVERSIVVPFTLLSVGPLQPAQKRPVVVLFAQQGKSKLLAARKADIARLLDAGYLVCLTDLRGCGETSPGSGRDRGSEATSLSASYLMVGDPLIAGRLRDLRSLLRQLRGYDFVDGKKIAVWADSLSSPNSPDVQAAVPQDVDQPTPAEPGPALVALLATLFEGDAIAATYARGGMSAYRDLLRSPFVHVPHDAIVPGVIVAGDVPGLMSALPEGKVRTVGTVDAWNRLTAPAGPEESSVADWLLGR